MGFFEKLVFNFNLLYKATKLLVPLCSRSLCCGSFFKRFTTPDLVRAYENVLKQLPQDLVKTTPAREIQLDKPIVKIDKFALRNVTNKQRLLGPK